MVRGAKVTQCYILSSFLFNIYTENIMRNVENDENYNTLTLQHHLKFNLKTATQVTQFSFQKGPGD